MTPPSIKPGKLNKAGEGSVYFVVVSWNNEDIILDCLESIRNQSYSNVKTILIDNNSGDTTVKIVKKKFRDVITIQNGKNEGFAIANNQGIGMALEDESCSYVALLNSDARIANDWAETITKFAKNHPNTAGMQTVTLDYFDHNILDSRGIKVDHQGRAIQLGYREVVATEYESSRIFGVNAAACIYTASFLRQQPFGNQYFDTDMWMYLEDVDLAARSTMMGYDNWLIGGSKALHMGSASSSKNPGFSVYMVYRNNLLLHIKNLPFLILVGLLPGLIVSDFMTILQLLRSKNYATVKAIIKGRVYSTPLMPLFFAKRRQLKQYRNITTHTLRKLMSSK